MAGVVGLLTGADCGPGVSPFSLPGSSEQQRDRPAAGLLETEASWQAVKAGWHHVCALDDAGLISCIEAMMPGAQVRVLPAVDVSDFATGTHVCTLDASQNTRCFALDDSSSELVPPNIELVAVDVGYDYACGIAIDGKVHCWGDDRGLGLLSAPSGDYVSISTGGTHACALDVAGYVTCWGPADGGPEDLGQVASTPKSPVRELAAGWSHTCASVVDDAAVCWGDSGRGALDRPAAPSRGLVSTVAATCGLFKEGGAWCWGGDRGPWQPSWERAESLAVGVGFVCGHFVEGGAECVKY